MRRSKVSQLPPELREELERQLVASSFSGYEQLADWLAEQGYAIGKSSLHREGSKLEERLAAIKLATESARAVVSAAPDDEGAVNDALIRLTQEKLFSMLVEVEEAGDAPVALPKVARAIADLGRASVQQKRFAGELKKRAGAKLGELEEKAARGGGITPEDLRRVREEIYGIAG